MALRPQETDYLFQYFKPTSTIAILIEGVAQESKPTLKLITKDSHRNRKETSSFEHS